MRTLMSVLFLFVSLFALDPVLHWSSFDDTSFSPHCYNTQYASRTMFNMTDSAICVNNGHMMVDYRPWIELTIPNRIGISFYMKLQGFNAGGLRPFTFSDQNGNGILTCMNEDNRIAVCIDFVSNVFKARTGENSGSNDYSMAHRYITSDKPLNVNINSDQWYHIFIQHHMEHFRTEKDSNYNNINKYAYLVMYINGIKQKDSINYSIDSLILQPIEFNQNTLSSLIKFFALRMNADQSNDKPAAISYFDEVKIYNSTCNDIKDIIFQDYTQFIPVTIIKKPVYFNIVKPQTNYFNLLGQQIEKQRIFQIKDVLCVQ